jgi:hypothetical protein
MKDRLCSLVCTGRTACCSNGYTAKMARIRCKGSQHCVGEEGGEGRGGGQHLQNSQLVGYIAAVVLLFVQ